MSVSPLYVHTHRPLHSHQIFQQTKREFIKKNRCMCTVTNLSAALLFDALYRKDVLSRGGYLHLYNRNSSAAFFPFCFWYHLIRSIKPFSSCSSSGVIHKSNPLLLRLLTASLPSLLLRLLLRESWRSSQKTLHPNRRSPDVRHGGGSNGDGLFPCCLWYLSEVFQSNTSLQW